MPSRPADLHTPAERELAHRAAAAADRAYAPYSEFPVGAALRTRMGQIVAGCNVENASYGLAICAERNAVAAAVALEGPGMRIAAIAVQTGSGTAAPCGACRQVLAEFGRDAQVLYTDAGAWMATTVAELLPDGFELEHHSAPP